MEWHIVLGGGLRSGRDWCGFGKEFEGGLGANMALR
jgi:hypothetical protein